MNLADWCYWPPVQPAGDEDLPSPAALERGVVAQCCVYNCWSDVNDSDHKPVYSLLAVDIPVVDFHKKRLTCSQLLEESTSEPAALDHSVVSLSPSSVKLHALHVPDQGVLLTNASEHDVRFAVRQRQKGPGPALGHLLSITPHSGIIPAGSELTLVLRLDTDESSFFSQPAVVTVDVLVGLPYSILSGGEEYCLALTVQCTCVPCS